MLCHNFTLRVSTGVYGEWDTLLYIIIIYIINSCLKQVQKLFISYSIAEALVRLYGMGICKFTN